MPLPPPLQFLWVAAINGWREAGMHPVLASAESVIGLGVLYWRWDTAKPWWWNAALAVALALLAYAPLVALRYHKGRPATVGLLEDSDKLKSARHVQWILERARLTDRRNGLPDVVIISKAASYWDDLFTTKVAATTRRLLQRNGALTLGIAIMHPDDPAVPCMVADGKGSDLAKTLRGTFEGLPKRLDQDFKGFAARVQVRVLPPGGILDSLCMYDPGAPYDRCIVMNIHKGWQDETIPVLFVSDCGEQRLLYDALRERIGRLWNKAEPLWPKPDAASPTPPSSTGTA